jgi:hypothetical protein
VLIHSVQYFAYFTVFKIIIFLQKFDISPGTAETGGRIFSHVRPFYE